MFEAVIKYTGIVGMGPREFKNKFLKPMYETMGQYWMKSIRPKHFTPSGGKEYGYRHRTIGYLFTKIKKLRHAKPLTWSGELEKMSRYSRFQHMREGMRIYLSKAKKALFRHPNSQVNMAQELTAVSKRDAVDLIRVGNRYLIARLRNHSRSVLKVIQ